MLNRTLIEKLLIDIERHSTGSFLRQEFHQSRYSIPLSQQEGGTTERTICDAEHPHSSTENTTNDDERISVDENLETLLQSPTVGSILHEGHQSVPHPTTQLGAASWLTDSGNIQPAHTHASFRPSSISDFTGRTSSSIEDGCPVLFNYTSLSPTSVSDFYSSFHSSLRGAHLESSLPASICPTSISDFITRAPQRTQDLPLGAMSIYPASFSDFTAALRTTESFRPSNVSEPSTDPTISDEFIISQAMHTDVVEPYYHHDTSTAPEVSPGAYNELSTNLTSVAPQQIISIVQ
jgi:hypothetical protein